MVMQVADELSEEWSNGMVLGLDFYRFMMIDAAAGAPTVLGEKLDECFVDGLHLSEYGYKLLYKAITTRLEEVWPQLLPQNLPMMAPWWGDLDVIKDFNTKKENEEREKQAGLETEIKRTKIEHEEL